MMQKMASEGETEEADEVEATVAVSTPASTAAESEYETTKTTNISVAAEEVEVKHTAIKGGSEAESDLEGDDHVMIKIVEARLRIIYQQRRRDSLAQNEELLLWKEAKAASATTNLDTRPPPAAAQALSRPGAYAEAGPGIVALQTAVADASTTHMVAANQEELEQDAETGLQAPQEHPGLVVADPVADMDASPGNLDLPVARQVVTTKRGLGHMLVLFRRRCQACNLKSKTTCIACIAMGILLLLAGGAIILGYLLKGNSGGNSKSKSPNSQLPLQSRLQMALPNSTARAIQNADSPQSLAYQFLLEDPSLADYEDWRMRQRFALATFFYATGGPRWKDSTNWLSYAQHECEWFARETHGFSSEPIDIIDHPFPCGGNPTGDYTHLWLFGNGLAGSIPDELSLLTGLESISMYYNSFDGSLPTSMGLLSNMRGINIAFTNITGKIPTEIGNMKALEALAVSDNRLSGPIPTELGLLPKLGLLWAENNQFTGMIPSSLGNCSDLTGVWLNSNQLTGGIPNEFGSLQKLRKLNLSGNNLTRTIPEELGDLSILQELQLSHNSLSGTIPSQLGSLTAIKRLSLHRNRLSETVPTELGGLSSLQKLLLFENTFVGQVPSELGELTALCSLNLVRSQFTGTIPTELSALRHLKELYLNGNALRGTIPIGIGALVNSGSLIRFGIIGNALLSGTVPSSLCSIERFDFECTHVICGCNCDCSVGDAGSNKMTVANSTTNISTYQGPT